MLGIRVGTVKSRMHRARQALCRALADDERRRPVNCDRAQAAISERMDGERLPAGSPPPSTPTSRSADGARDSRREPTSCDPRCVCTPSSPSPTWSSRSWSASPRNPPPVATSSASRRARHDGHDPLPREDDASSPPPPGRTSIRADRGRTRRWPDRRQPRRGRAVPSRPGGQSAAALDVPRRYWPRPPVWTSSVRATGWSRSTPAPPSTPRVHRADVAQDAGPLPDAVDRDHVGRPSARLRDTGQRTHLRGRSHRLAHTGAGLHRGTRVHRTDDDRHAAAARSPRRPRCRPTSCCP